MHATEIRVDPVNSHNGGLRMVFCGGTVAYQNPSIAISCRGIRVATRSSWFQNLSVWIFRAAEESKQTSDVAKLVTMFSRFSLSSW